MPECGHAQVEADALTVLLEVSTQRRGTELGTFGDHDDGVSLAVLVGAANGVLHFLRRGLDLRNQDDLGTAGDARHQGEVAAVATHDLD